MITFIVAAVYVLGLVGWAAILVWLLRNDPWFGTVAEVNPEAVALIGAITAVAWPAALIASVLIRLAQPRR